MYQYFEEEKDDRKNYEGCKKWKQKEREKHNNRGSSGNASVMYNCNGGNNRCKSKRIRNNKRYQREYKI